jgi:hypothetical protein
LEISVVEYSLAPELGILQKKNHSIKLKKMLAINDKNQQCSLP